MYVVGLVVDWCANVILHAAAENVKQHIFLHILRAVLLFVFTWDFSYTYQNEEKRITTSVPKF